MMSGKPLTTLLLSMTLGGLCSLVVADERKWAEILFGVEALVPPFESRNAQGELVGLNIELGNALCAELDARCVWVDQDYATNIAALEAGRFDAIMPMSATPQRRQKIDFTENLYPLGSRLVTRKNMVLMPDGQLLKGKRVGVLAGTSREAFAQARWAPAGVLIQSFKLNDELIDSLLTGKIDATLQDTIEISAALLDRPQGHDFGFSGPVIIDELLGSGVAMGVRKTDPDLRDALNKALAQVKQNGQYDSIIKRYLSESSASATVEPVAANSLQYSPEGKGLPFSQAVRLGSTLYLSGVLGIGTNEKLVPGGIRAEMTQAMNLLGKALERNGSSFAHVAKCTVILADIGDFSAMNAVYVRYFPEDRLPVRTTFSARKLLLDARVEVECLAAIKS
ncbi:transporter substrate-binding domain-containing protein [Pseudomonas fluorescens]|uniref:Aminoacrylate peracid reductase RutC n=1 Tax=Pseudomonas fluorescens TaxID=294 RepID=A0A5E7BFN8_PSEFL|nr:transporter substrate-binding domain-containing protein [Pseudomonas fluorescens]VVN90898.1 Putative aminoacrylate peracid reductase RutC [Pseudomonas fluorescens]